MGQKKDDLLKRIAEEKAREKRTVRLEKQDEAPVKMTSRMPIGCWIWLTLIGIGAFMLLRKYLEV